MSRRTKKLGSVARFGPRYGVSVRAGIKAAEERKNKDYKCPNCHAVRVNRVDTSIWSCQHCGLVFAGAAYMPSKERK